MPYMKLSALMVFLVVASVLSCRHSSTQVLPPTRLTSAILLEAGTTLAFRTAQEIDLPSAQLGQTYAVVVNRDANAADGQTVLPSGSPAVLIVLAAQTPTESKPSFVLGIASATLNGDTFLARNQSNADDMVGSASLGAFIGGVAGTVWQSGLKPELDSAIAIRCPIGSLLTFRLDRPIQLIGSHK